MCCVVKNKQQDEVTMPGQSFSAGLVSYNAKQATFLLE